jgi:hypothetical protein
MTDEDSHLAVLKTFPGQPKTSVNMIQNFSIQSYKKI